MVFTEVRGNSSDVLELLGIAAYSLLYPCGRQGRATKHLAQERFSHNYGGDVGKSVGVQLHFTNAPSVKIENKKHPTHLHHLRALTQPVRSGGFDGGLQNGLRLDFGRLDVWAAVDAGNVPLIRLCAASMGELERRPVEQRPNRALPFSFVKEGPPP